MEGGGGEEHTINLRFVIQMTILKLPTWNKDSLPFTFCHCRIIYKVEIYMYPVDSSW